MATYCSILVWEVPWIEEPRGLNYWGHKRIEHDLAARTTTTISFSSASDRKLLRILEFLELIVVLSYVNKVTLV